MQLTSKQESGLKIAVSKYKNREHLVVISGYAGTGKSELVKFIIAALGVKPEDVAYTSYTGKGAQVLAQKGCFNPTTTHKLLYDSHLRKDGTFYHKPKKYLPYKVVVVDEVSMLPKPMWELLLSHKNVFIIALGDDFQLPAIEEQNDVLKKPDIFLDEIMRQAEDNEIIELSMKIRNREKIKPGMGESVNIVRKNEFYDSMCTWSDQTICATNKTKNNLNRLVRYNLFGYEPPLPQINDKMICLRNDWDRGSGDPRNPTFLVNGLTGNLKSLKEITLNLSLGYNVDCLTGDFVTDDGVVFKDLLIDKQLLQTGEPTINRNNFYLFKDIQLEQFDWGWAISCWKSQGSEYNKVLGFEEYFPRNNLEHARYMYTLVTRAKEKLTLVLKD